MTVEAITFDFYSTLIYPRSERGRGACLMEYLGTQGLESDPWEHQALYDVFEAHGREYEPDFTEAEKRLYYRRFAERVFERLRVRAASGEAARHATQVWELLGPAAFAVFPEVPSVLRALAAAGYRLGVISNWQCGLSHFCAELGLADFFEEILASAEVGAAKPEPAIFREACRRLGAPARRVLHVGDSLEDDYEGARLAGLQAIHLDRTLSGSIPKVPAVHSLEPLPEMLA